MMFDDLEVSKSEKDLYSKICHLIDVNKPYYALQGLCETGHGEVYAEIDVERLEYDEVSPISLAEAGRHLAILGSCALSLINKNKSKHYYLANKASILFHSSKISPFNEQQRKLKCFAKTIHLDDKTRTGSVSSRIYTENDQLIFTIDLSYFILREALFTKMFGQQQTKLLQDNFIVDNPYKFPVTLKQISITENRLTCTLGKIEPYQCIGHFPSYPALPVSILISAFIDSAGIFLKSQYPEYGKIRIVQFNVMAKELAFAGKKVNIETNLLEYSGKNYHFSCHAIDEDKNLICKIFTSIDVITQSDIKAAGR
jgi:3-hydroxymyristoyl/3-hydroxydecanoyl-(acyl carrier protein) dehydratase